MGLTSLVTSKRSSQQIVDLDPGSLLENEAALGPVAFLASKARLAPSLKTTGRGSLNNTVVADERRLDKIKTMSDIKLNER